MPDPELRPPHLGPALLQGLCRCKAGVTHRIAWLEIGMQLCHDMCARLPTSPSGGKTIPTDDPEVEVIFSMDGECGRCRPCSLAGHRACGRGGSGRLAQRCAWDCRLAHPASVQEA